MVALQRWQDLAVQLRDTGDDPVDDRLDPALELHLLGLVQERHVGVAQRLQTRAFQHIRVFAIEHFVRPPGKIPLEVVLEGPSVDAQPA